MGAHNGVLSLDLRHLNQVAEVDDVSLLARIGAGASGPELSEQLAAHGLTLRHYPQSFEFSTLGGWIATRAGGHFATLYTHIDELVAGTRLITPTGTWSSRPLPGSGAGPSPDRMVCGSEGILGVITEAWMRIRPLPRFRASGTFRFTEWTAAVDATRALAQSGLYPSNCRLLDRGEAMLHQVSLSGHHLLLLGFEHARHGVGEAMQAAKRIAETHGGHCTEGIQLSDTGSSSNGDPSAQWKQAFFDAPYLASTLATLGVMADTFETACTWKAFGAMHEALVSTLNEALRREGGAGLLTCRFTHVYPDGPAPYYTFVTPARTGFEHEHWLTIKSLASDILLEHGATITHHHAVGRTHRPWYDRQRPEPFARSLRAAKRELDPQGLLNPGVLIDP
jgi:alkyldihydroxyacetonephosphate synthase